MKFLQFEQVDCPDYIQCHLRIAHAEFSPLAYTPSLAISFGTSFRLRCVAYSDNSREYPTVRHIQMCRVSDNASGGIPSDGFSQNLYLFPSNRPHYRR